MVLQAHFQDPALSLLGNLVQVRAPCMETERSPAALILRLRQPLPALQGSSGVVRHEVRQQLRGFVASGLVGGSMLSQSLRSW